MESFIISARSISQPVENPDSAFPGNKKNTVSFFYSLFLPVKVNFPSNEMLVFTLFSSSFFPFRWNSNCARVSVYRDFYTEFLHEFSNSRFFRLFLEIVIIAILKW